MKWQLMIWITNQEKNKSLHYPHAEIGLPKINSRLSPEGEKIVKETLVGVYVTEEYAASCVIRLHIIKEQLG